MALRSSFPIPTPGWQPPAYRAVPAAGLPSAPLPALLEQVAPPATPDEGWVVTEHHEAGHVVAAVLLGYPVERAHSAAPTEPGGWPNGHAVIAWWRYGRQRWQASHRAIIQMAGPAAEAMTGVGRAWAARLHAADLRTMPHVWPDGITPAQQTETIAGATRTATEWVAQHGPAVAAVAALLRAERDQWITGDRLCAAVRTALGWPADVVAWRNPYDRPVTTSWWLRCTGPCRHRAIGVTGANGCGGPTR